MMKAPPSKALVIKINLVFLACFLIVYATLILSPTESIYQENATSIVRSCSLGECHGKVERTIKMKAVLENTGGDSQLRPIGNTSKIEPPRFLNEMRTKKSLEIGMINMEEDDISEWKYYGDIVPIHFEKVSEFFEWKDLFPEWIDEEEDNDGPSCPEIPMPDFTRYEKMDMIVAQVPCKYPEKGWERDVLRLQVHLIAANLAAKKGKRDWGRRPKVLLLSKCRPMMELLRCDDLVRKEGDWWLYEPDMSRLDQKISLPVGSCKLAMPLWGQGTDEAYDLSEIKDKKISVGKHEAYVTVLHSSESYVCGAITLAQSLLKTGTKRDLIILVDKSISQPKLDALEAAGWKIRLIKRIRNPKAEKGTYNEYNYSKFRLWQLTEYNKVIFIDSDIIVLRNLDALFNFPQMSATGNDGMIFNSGVMVLEPSICTFRVFMKERSNVVSYNGGDQGFLNEMFVWWHRLPRRVNFLKNFWSNTSLERSMKNQLFGSDPPKLYAIHYLGWKPWLCYRDYDCNWDVVDQRVYASDVAHERWWKLHDGMNNELKEFCLLTRKRRTHLNWERRRAMKMRLPDQHWKINVTDPRKKHVIV